MLLPSHSQPEPLSGKQYVIVILRLLIDEQGQLVYGEVVDRAGRSRSRFAKWSSLEKAVRNELDAIEDENDK